MRDRQIKELARILEKLETLGNKRLQLEGISDHVCRFNPGLRTRDDGELGDISGEIVISPQNPHPNVADWLLFRNGELVASAETAAGQPLRLLATRGGVYRLTMHDRGDNRVLGHTSLSIPQFVRVIAPVEEVAPNMVELGVPEAQRQALWNAIIAVARPVCHHILRPANVRLIWSEDQLPEFFREHPVPDNEAPLSPVKAHIYNPADGPRQAYQVPTTVILTSPASNLCSTVDFMGRVSALAAEYLATAGARMPALHVLFPQFMAAPVEDEAARHLNEQVWGFDGGLSALDFGIARVGLGAFDFVGGRTADAHGTDVDQALAAAAFTTNAAGARVTRIDWTDPASAPYMRFVELAGRQVGVFAARATLRMIGAPVAAESEGHVTAEGGNDVVIGGILAPAPHNPLQDILGLHRPPERAFDQLSDDLDNQQTRANTGRLRVDRLPEVATRWADLVALEKAGIRTERAMPGATSAYDALTGMVTDASINFVDARLGLLPAAYGPYELRPGDRDTAIGAEHPPVYGGVEQPEGRPADDIIGVLQRDLHAIGIKLGLPTPAAGAAQEYNGFYGYRRFARGNAKYDGELAEEPSDIGANLADEVIRGHSEWAVREFQIATSYPNMVAEAIGDERHYAQRLHVLNVEPQPAEPEPEQAVPPPATPSADINGRLTILKGGELRRWRFQRRRPQIVIVAGTEITQDGGGPFTPPNNRDIGQNLDRLDEFPDNVYRMYVFDRSGYFGANPQRAVLGDYGTYLHWGGTRAVASHAATPVTLANTIGLDLAPQPVEDFHSVYRVVAAVSEAESVGHFDGLNGYDDAIFSYPLFHHTLTLTGFGNDASRPGQMAGFVRWLQDPPNDLLEAVFPDPGGNAPNYPAPYPDQEGVNDRRTDMRNRFHEVFNQTFGFFGVGASATDGNPLQGFITAAGLLGGTTPAGNVVDIRVVWPGANANGLRQQALYQSYQQWFRAWPWFYRFAAALRQNQTLRTLLFAYELDWAQRRFNQDQLLDDIRTEAGRAVYIRIAVRGSGFFTRRNAHTAVTNARLIDPNVDEARAIRDAIDRETARRDRAAQAAEDANDLETARRERNARDKLQSLSRTVRVTMEYNSAEAGEAVNPAGLQDNLIYERVRNDILRRLIAH